MIYCQFKSQSLIVAEWPKELRLLSRGQFSIRKKMQSASLIVCINHDPAGNHSFAARVIILALVDDTWLLINLVASCTYWVRDAVKKRQGCHLAGSGVNKGNATHLHWLSLVILNHSVKLPNCNSPFDWFGRNIFKLHWLLKIITSIFNIFCHWLIYWIVNVTRQLLEYPLSSSQQFFHLASSCSAD